MAASLVDQHQITTFTSPVNGTTPIDANVVRGNDNTIKTAYDAHDADGTIHFQDSTLAARPAASTTGLKWMSNDGYRIYYDDGAAWHEAAYLPTAGGTVSGNVVITGTLEVDGNFSVNTNKFTVTASSGNTLVAGTLGATGLITATAGIQVTGGATADGGIIKDATNGLYLQMVAGATNDFNLLLPGAGASVLRVAHGAAHAIFGANVTASRLIASTDIATAIAKVVASDGTYSASDAAITSVLGSVTALTNSSTGNTFIAAKAQIIQSAAAASTNSYAFHSAAVATHTSGTLPTLIGVDAVAYVTGVGGTTTNAISLMVQSTVAASTTVTGLTGVQVRTGLGISGTVATAVGVDVLDITGATTNYGLRTGAGIVLLCNAAAGYVVIGPAVNASNATNACIAISNTTAPSGNAVSGGFIYCEAGALKYRGSGGTITVLGVA